MPAPSPVINQRVDGLSLAHLATLPRWVLWREETRGNLITKVPYSPVTGGMAKANDQTGWGTREQAQTAAPYLLNCRGVGVMLGQINDEQCLGGIDLDTCRDPNTGEIAEWAVKILRTFRTYAEVSPSNTGVKLFFHYHPSALSSIRGQMAGPLHSKMFKQQGGGPHPPAIEFHTGNRYFAVTDMALEWLPPDIHRGLGDNISNLIRKIGPLFAGKTLQEENREFNDFAGVEPPPSGQRPFPDIDTGDDEEAAQQPPPPPGDLWERVHELAFASASLDRLLHDDFRMPDKSGSGKAMSMARNLYNGGFTEQEVHKVLSEWSHTKEWAATKAQTTASREFSRMWAEICKDPPKHGHDAEEDVDFGPAAGPKKPSNLLPLVYFHEIQPNLDAADFVEDVLTEGGMSVVYGESNCGKTFFATDLSLHIAMGKVWRGKQIERGGVIYCALEGSHGIQNRVAAFRQHYAMTGVELPFAVIPVTLNLLDPTADMPRLLDAIKRANEQMEAPVKMLVMDTLSRAMAGGNENAPDDMGALVTNDAKIRQAVNVHNMWIHHSGKDAAKGARGHSLLRAATDTEIEIVREDKDSPSIATVRKQRDMEITGEWPFRLQTVDLGANRRGKPVTSCIVVDADGVADAAPKVKLSGDQQMALRVLHDTLAEVGVPDFPGVPQGQNSIPEAWWRDRYYSRVKPGADAATKRKSFRRAADMLVEFGVAAANHGRVWTP